MYTVVSTKNFQRHLKTLRTRLRLSDDEIAEFQENLWSVLEHYQETGDIIGGYDDHFLVNKPWIGYREFHVLDDVLVVYADISTQNVIRLMGVYNHDMLHQGKL